MLRYCFIKLKSITQLLNFTEMTTIMQSMKKGERNKTAIAEKQLLNLELRLISAKDFAQHKVEYYKELIKQHKETFADVLYS